jgi:hypothetical protein
LAEFAEDVPDVLSTDRSTTTKIPAIAALERLLGHQCEHVAFPGDKRAEPAVGAAGGQKAGSRPSGSSAVPGDHPAQRLDELPDVGDPVLEQVPDAGRGSGRWDKERVSESSRKSPARK